MTNNLTAQTFVLERRIIAPLELVWNAHTAETHLRNWWGPQGAKMIACKLELRPGGVFHYGLQMPDGATIWGKFVFREIVHLRKLVFVMSFSNEAGEVAPSPFGPGWPLEILKTFTFQADGDSTIISITGEPINATEQEQQNYQQEFEGMKQGFGGSYEQLQDYLNRLHV